jgi:hypothetical protein
MTGAQWCLGAAGNLAANLIQAGAARLGQLVTEAADRQALQRAYKAALAEAFAQVAGEMDEVQRDHAQDLLENLVKQPQVAERFVECALNGDPLDAEAVRRAAPAAIDLSTLPFALDRAIAAFSETLPQAIRREAARAQSALFNRLVVAQLDRILNALAPAVLSDFRASIKNFISSYLGTPQDPKPFGGREAVLRELSDWLDEGGQPYLVLAAEAGRGKTALLVRWSERLAARRDLRVIFIPVSIRFETNSPEFVFGALAAALAGYHGEQTPWGLRQLSGWQLRDLCLSFMTRERRSGPRALVILDGLDEAVGWEAGPSLFPTSPPDWLRVVVSARLRPDRPDAAAWASCLGWQGLARLFSLEPLSREGIKEVLDNMGFPLAELSRRGDIVGELHRLSEGDPLVVGLYVQDLWQRGDEAVRLRPEDLARLEPGLEGYFDRWLEDQRRLWRADWRQRERQLLALLRLLACALGPLPRQDLLELLAPDQIGGLDLDMLLGPLGRLIAGDGRRSGYVFSHPKLAAYFYDRLGAGERQRLENRFADWGRQCFEKLRSGEPAPTQISPYLARFLGEHLERAGAPVGQIYELLSKEWLEATTQVSDGPQLFWNEAERVWRLALREGPSAVGQLVRAALCFSSVASLGEKTPAGLLALCVRHGVMSLSHAMVLAREKHELRDRARALTMLAPLVAEGEREQVVAEALATAWKIEREVDGAEALAALAPLLAEGERAQVVDEVLRAASQTKAGYGGRLGKVLAALAAQLEEPHRTMVLNQALATARGLNSPLDRAEALAALAPLVAEAERDQVIHEALEAASQIEPDYGWRRVRVLAALAGLVPESQRGEVLDKAVAVAKTIGGDWGRGLTFAALAPWLPEPDRESALAEALVALQTPDEEDRWAGTELVLEILGGGNPVALEGARLGVEILASLGPHLPERLLPMALAVAREIPWEAGRAEVLAALVPRLSESERAEVLRGALEAFKRIGDGGERAETLAALAERLGEPHRTQALREALATAREIGQRGERARVLGCLAAQLGEPERTHVLGEALASAQQIESAQERAEALASLAPQLAELERTKAVEEALAAVSRLAEEDPWAPIRSLRTLGELAPHLSEPARSEVLAKVLAAAREDFMRDSEFAYLRASVALARHLPESPARARLIADILSDARDTPTEEERPWSLIEFASSLIELAPLLVGLQRADVLAEALAAARKIKRPKDYVPALAALVPHLPEAQRADVLAEALVAAESIGSERERAETLTDLAAQLEEPERTHVLAEALAAARKIGWPEDYVRALAALVPHLPEAQRADVLAEALVAVRQIPGEADRARVLMALIERLPPRLLRQALGAAREIRSPQGRHELLMALAARLAEPDRSEVLAEALAAARQIEDPAVRAYKLAGMVGELPEPLRSQVIAETLSLLLGDPVAPRVVPDSFLLHLPPHQRSEVAAHVLVASFDQEPHMWLPLVNPRKLVPHLLAEQSPTVFDGFARYLRARCQAGRPAILRRLDAAVIEYLGGAAAIEQTARAVADVGQWWP